MPALFDSLVHVQGLEAHKAWRVAYIVPFIIITFVALCILLFCPDTPTGKWSERHLYVGELSPDNTSVINGVIVTMAPSITDKQSAASEKAGSDIKASNDNVVDCEAQLGEGDVWKRPKGELVVAPTFKKALGVISSKHSLALALPYACSFGKSGNYPFLIPPNETSAYRTTGSRRRTRHKRYSWRLLPQELPDSRTNQIRAMGRHVRAPQRCFSSFRWLHC